MLIGFGVADATVRLVLHLSCGAGGDLFQHVLRMGSYTVREASTTTRHVSHSTSPYLLLHPISLAVLLLSCRSSAA